MDIHKIWGWILGVFFLLFGVWGFVEPSVLGIVQTNLVQNTVHLTLAAIFFLGAWKGDLARPVNQWVGIIIIVLAIIGFSGALTPLAISAGNDWNNWLNVLIGFVTVGIGWFVK